MRGTSEDKGVCTKRHHISCKSGLSCEWTSCEFLHNTEKQDNEPVKTKELEKIVESKIEGHATSVNNGMESMMQLLVRIEEENKNTCQKLTTNAEEHKIKLVNLENKCELLERQVKSFNNQRKVKNSKINPSNKVVPQTRPAVQIEQVQWNCVIFCS